eukprot:1508515-Prymnesium_polylepis.1
MVRLTSGMWRAAWRRRVRVGAAGGEIAVDWRDGAPRRRPSREWHDRRRRSHVEDHRRAAIARVVNQP